MHAVIALSLQNLVRDVRWMMSVEDYLLLIETGHAVQQELNRRSLDACGLTLQQAIVLSQIDASKGRATISQLAFALGRASHSISGMINALEDAGFVDRERSNGDRRQVHVSLAAEGKRCLAAFKQASPNLVSPPLTGILSREEANRISALLVDIADGG